MNGADKTVIERVIANIQQSIKMRRCGYGKTADELLKAAIENLEEIIKESE
jgi:hypothetical protein